MPGGVGPRKDELGTPLPNVTVIIVYPNGNVCIEWHERYLNGFGHGPYSHRVCTWLFRTWTKALSARKPWQQPGSVHVRTFPSALDLLKEGRY